MDKIKNMALWIEVYIYAFCLQRLADTLIKFAENGCSIDELEAFSEAAKTFMDAGVENHNSLESAFDADEYPEFTATRNSLVEGYRKFWNAYHEVLRKERKDG